MVEFVIRLMLSPVQNSILSGMAVIVAMGMGWTVTWVGDDVLLQLTP